MEDLYELFTPVSVELMDVEEIRLLTAEPADVVIERNENKARLQRLRGILDICNASMDMQRMGRLGTYSDVSIHDSLDAFDSVRLELKRD